MSIAITQIVMSIVTIITALIAPIALPMKQVTIQLIPLKTSIPQKMLITITDLQKLVVKTQLKLIQKAQSDAMVLVENKCVS